MTAGADERNAGGVAEHLVLANLSGVDTHGVWHIPGYVEDIQNEWIVPKAWPDTLDDAPNKALVTGHWTFGQVTARYAMGLGIEKAKEHGMAAVGIVQCHHIGRLGHYVEMAAAENMISMVWAGGFGEQAPATAPYGGRERLLHTNPLAMGFPTGDADTPTMFDFATTGLSGVKVKNAQRRGDPLPPGCIVDKEGNPSTDPEAFFEGGAYLPFGTHKGYAIMMATEYLGQVLTGSQKYADPDRGGDILRHQGVTMMVFRADLFQPLADFTERAGVLNSKIRAIAPAPGFDEVLVPGDPESRTRAARRKDGIPIEDPIWDGIVETAKGLGLADI